MATGKRKEGNVYINLGKIPGRKLSDGKPDNSDKIIAINKNLADLVGAKYTFLAPLKQITFTRGNSKGITYQRETGLTTNRVRFQLGYIIRNRLNPATKRIVPVIKWVPLEIPSGSNLKDMLSVVRTKFTRRPAYLKMPSGNTTRFVT